MDYKDNQMQSLQTLKTEIREKEPRRLYFFHGEETFLLHHYLEQLKKLLIDDLTESFNYHRFTNETFDLQAFGDAVENLPMMAERTMVRVDDIDLYKLPEAERTKIGEILSDVPEYCTVVFTYETTPWKPDARMKKFHETLMTNGFVVEFPKQNQRELITWITRHFAAKGKQIKADLCAYLIEITGGTMTALSGEIQKISAYSGAHEIVKSDIDAVTEPVLDAVVFQMTDMLGKGDFGGALLKLQQLIKMQQDPISILGAIGGHFRCLAAARILLDNGKGYSDLRKCYSRLSDYAAKKNMETARRFKPEFLARASELILQTDRYMKTSYDDNQRLLELLVLQLAQEARHD